MTNYKFVQANLNVENGQLVVTLVLILSDSTKHPEIVTKLNAENKLKVGYEYRVFSAADTTVEATESPGSAPIQLPCIQIKFEHKGAYKMFKYVDYLLHKHGVSLSRSQYFVLKTQFLDGAEKFSVRRASKIINQAVKNNNFGLDDYVNLQDLIYRTTIEQRLSLLNKIVRLLMAHSLNNYALSLAIVYKDNVLIKDLVQELQSRLAGKVSSDQQQDLEQLQTEIINSPTELTPILSSNIDIFKDDPEQLSFGLSNLEPAVTDNLLAHLETEFNYKQQDYKFSVLKSEVDSTQVANVIDTPAGAENVNLAEIVNVNQRPKILFSFERDVQYQIFDQILIQLEKNGYVWNLDLTWQIREQLGFTKKHYHKFADTFIELSADKGDDRTTFEYNWLVRMAYEAPTDFVAEFVYDTAKKLQARGLLNCALAYAYIAKNDPLCSDLQPFIAELSATIAASAKPSPALA